VHKAGARAFVELDRVADRIRLSVLKGGCRALGAQNTAAHLEEHDLEAVTRIVVSPGGEPRQDRFARCADQPRPPVTP